VGWLSVCQAGVRSVWFARCKSIEYIADTEEIHLYSISRHLGTRSFFGTKASTSQSTVQEFAFVRYASGFFSSTTLRARKQSMSINHQRRVDGNARDGLIDV
jgi:hypothetical protein